MTVSKITLPRKVYAELENLLRTSPKFDPDWYRERYPDVGILGYTADEHFLRIGDWMGRPPHPDFDSRFYKDTYRIWHIGKTAFADYLTAEGNDQRPTSPAELAAQVAALEAETQAVWGATGQRSISYCIPVMGRLTDLHATLAENLQANLEYRHAVEFLVIEFGETNEVRDWITAEPAFTSALADGYLRVVSDTKTLDTWHFGKAKNAFKPHLTGRTYSSLDADNFVTAEETAWLLAIADRYPAGFMAHHFTGTWGDGTSGRVSLPTAMYRASGYDARLLPRQWDEMDMILGTLKRFPAVPFVILDRDMKFLGSRAMRSFVELERLPNRIILSAYARRLAPLNPRGEGYTLRDPLLEAMGNFNAAVSKYRRSTSADRREGYLKTVYQARAKLIDVLPPERAVEMLFKSGPPPRPAGKNDICLFACVKDEEDLLPRFISHHRALGVNRFCLVDDGSDIPVKSLNLGPDVAVFRTKTGDFRTSKTLWVEALAAAVVPEGGWMLTLDADELLQLPLPHKDLAGLTAALAARGVAFAPGLLLDMLPADPAAEPKPHTDLVDHFDSFCWRDGPPDPAYLQARPIAWGFGKHAALSWRVDARYHAFGTIDSLRKIPLMRRRKGWRLNQGFHTLYPFPSSSGSEPGPEVFAAGPILPVFHYKLARLWSDSARARMVSQAENYFPRTGRNIKAIFGADDFQAGLGKLKTHLRPAKDALSSDIFSVL
jgi:hypothetical protein